MSKKYLLLFIFTFLLIALLFPKFSSAAADHLVISQVQIAGTTADDEFVELFNPTESNVDLSTYKLTRKNSGGVTEVNLVASLSGTIASNGYFLIGHGTGYDGSAPLDKIYSAPSNALTNNYSVLLYSSNNLIDKVGFGSSPEFETAVFPTNPPANGSIRRIDNNDTNNNSVDFELLQASDPKNSSFVSATETPIASPTPNPIETVSPTSTPSPSPSLSPTNTPSPTPLRPSPTDFAGQAPTPKPEKNKHRDKHEIKLPFGFRCGFDRHEFEFKNHHFKYYKFHFGRR